MPDRISARCPHCGQPNLYTVADLEQTQPAARGSRVLRAAPPAGPQEYIVTCRRCHQAFKVMVPRDLQGEGGAR